MAEIPTQIALECLFCKSTKFEVPNKDYMPQEGEAIKCVNCGELNDVSAIKKVSYEKGKEALSQYIKQLWQKK